MLIKGVSPPREGQDALLQISSVLLCPLPVSEIALRDGSDAKAFLLQI